jgi:hypothetical protein
MYRRMYADGSAGEYKTVVSQDVSVCPMVEAGDFQWLVTAAGMPTAPQWRRFTADFQLTF